MRLRTWRSVSFEVEGPQLCKPDFLALQEELFAFAERLPGLRVEVGHADYEPPYLFTAHFQGDLSEEEFRQVYGEVTGRFTHYFT